MIILQLDSTELNKVIERGVRNVLKELPLTTNQQPTQETDQLLTVKETAKFLKLSVPTIYSKVSKGELPFMKRSKRLYFSKMELLEYLRGGKTKY